MKIPLLLFAVPGPGSSRREKYEGLRRAKRSNAPKSKRKLDHLPGRNHCPDIRTLGLNAGALRRDRYALTSFTNRQRNGGRGRGIDLDKNVALRDGAESGMCHGQVIRPDQK
jgi:hypothetical protein